MNLKNIKNIITNTDLSTPKTAIVRVDYNVPLKETSGVLEVADDQRLLSSKETIDFLLSHQYKVILISHLGRPSGKGFEEKYSLAPVYKYIKSQNWWSKFSFCQEEFDSAELQTKASSLEVGEVLLLENLRFNVGEKKNNPDFTQDLADLADFYVNEAFSSCHRAHASIVGLAEQLPSFAGFGLQKEVEALEKVILAPVRPLVVVVGGAKISDKVAAVVNLAHQADQVLVGGGVANNFINAAGIPIFNSYIQDAPADQEKEGVSYVDVAAKIMQDNQGKIIIPTDMIVGQNLEVSQANTQLIDLANPELLNQNDENLKNEMYLDIGPKTITLFEQAIANAGTIFWNGPMGVFENPALSLGTKSIATAVAQSSATTVLGGGDTIAAARQFEIQDQVTYISTAGSAALEFLAGEKLPGLVVLEN